MGKNSALFENSKFEARFKHPTTINQKANG